MHRFVLIAIALASGCPFAHGAEAPRHTRLVTLMSRPVLRYLMFTPGATSLAHIAYAEKFAVLPDEVAGRYVNALVELEVAMAKRFALPFEKVTAQVDLLLDLAAPSAGRLTHAEVLARVRKHGSEPFGPAYDELFLRELARTEVSGSDPAVPALADTFLKNLATNLDRIAAAGRAALRDGTPPAGRRVRAWLRAPLPALASTRPWQTPRVLERPTTPASARALRLRRTHAMAECVRRFLD